MTKAPGAVDPAAHPRGGRGRIAAGAAGLIVILVAVTALRAGGGGPPAGPAPSATRDAPSAMAAASDPSRFLLSAPQRAPTLALFDQDERPFDLATLRGTPAFVFFGYTHCPDVCPATVGAVGLAMEAFGRPAKAVFVTVDPERDTPSWLREYVRYLATGFVAVTGQPSKLAATAAAWGVRYAKVETGTPGEYSMSHTADVFLVDGDGLLRARFPFGTEASAMAATLRAVAGEAAATAAPTLSPSVPPRSAPPVTTDQGLGVTIGSSSVWAGPAGPVIFSLSAAGTRIDDPDLVPRVQLETRDGAPIGPELSAVAVRPPGETRVLYVASPAIPGPGWWRIAVSADRAGITLLGSTDVAARDPGTTAALGGPAPTTPTPTLADVGGLAKAVTTDPAPDLRLSQLSTADALAAHRPFVLVIDSWKFKVTSACGRALVMARYLLDRWPDDTFIHLEPLRYDVVTDTPVLVGSLGDPTLTDAAAAWGLGGDPWGPTSMPWVFVVDGNGIVRAKAEGVMGSDDVDVILALIAAGR